MSTRSRHAALLAELVTQRTQLRRAECLYLGQGRDRYYSGWQQRWPDGPTAGEMRALVQMLAGQVPALDIAELRYDRGHTDLADAAALLRHLDAHPDEAGYLTTFTVDVAFEATSYPERSPQPWLDRAQALLSLSPHATVSGDVLRVLSARALAHDWPAVLAWLDAIDVARSNPDVIDLAARRRGR